MKFTANLPVFDFYSDHPLSLDFVVKNGCRLNKAPTSATYALIVGDNYTVMQIRCLVQDYGMPQKAVRIKHVPVTRVINIKTSDATNYIYIGRGSKWGNPHSHLTGERVRNDAIATFSNDFENNLFLNIDMKANIDEIAGCVLGCSCKQTAVNSDTTKHFDTTTIRFKQ